jgi:hypothetical protein
VGSPFTPGKLAEVEVTPNTDDTIDIIVTIKGKRDGHTDEVTATIKILIWTDDIQQTAIEMRELFIPYLEQNYPQLGITSSTTWEGTIVAPRTLVVMHYLFFNDEWEMGVMWHVTIYPDNWATIYLRKRTVEWSPSLALKIPSWSEGGDIYEIDPPTEVDR